MKKVFFILILFTATISNIFGAVDDYVAIGGKEILQIGVTGQFAYFGLVGGFTMQTTNPENLEANSMGVVFIDLSNPGGRAMYATIVAAKANGQRVQRCGYAVTGGQGLMTYASTLSFIEIKP